MRYDASLKELLSGTPVLSLIPGFDEAVAKAAEKAAEKAADKAAEKAAQQVGADTLRAVLHERFGVLPRWAEVRIADPDPNECQKWIVRAIKAESLDDVFASN